MRQRYYIRKTPENSWSEISGEEFYQLVNSPEGSGRHFFKMDNNTLEVPKEMLDAWRKQDRHSDYLKEQTTGWKELSLYSDGIYGCSNGEEAVADTTVNVEEEVLRNTEWE